MVKCKNSCSNNLVSGYLRKAKATAAVNKDADAPIFKAAHDDTPEICSKSSPRPLMLSCLSSQNQHTIISYLLVCAKGNVA